MGVQQEGADLAAYQAASLMGQVGKVFVGQWGRCTCEVHNALFPAHRVKQVEEYQAMMPGKIPLHVGNRPNRRHGAQHSVVPLCAVCDAEQDDCPAGKAGF